MDLYVQMFWFVSVLQEVQRRANRHLGGDRCRGPRFGHRRRENGESSASARFVIGPGTEPVQHPEPAPTCCPGDQLHHAVHHQALRPPGRPHGARRTLRTLRVSGRRIGEEDAEGGGEVGQEQREGPRPAHR